MAARHLKFTGLVLREVNTGESGKLLTVLRDDGARVTVSAYGVRSYRSRSLGAARTLCCDAFDVSVSAQGRMTLAEASVIEDFPHIREDLDALLPAQFIPAVLTELTEDGGEPSEDGAALLSLALNMLYALDRKLRPVRQIMAVFQLRVALLCGFAPDCTICGDCGEVIREGQTDVWLDVMRGQTLCGECAEKRLSGEVPPEEGVADILRALPPPVLEALRYVLTSDLRRCLAFRLDDGMLPVFASLAEVYLFNHLGHGSAAIRFWHTIADENAPSQTDR